MSTQENTLKSILGDDWFALQEFNETAKSPPTSKSSISKPWGKSPRSLTSIPDSFTHYYATSDLDLSNPAVLVAMDVKYFKAWIEHVSSEPAHLKLSPFAFLDKKQLKNPNNTKNCFLLPLSVKGVYTGREFWDSDTEMWITRIFQSREKREIGAATKGMKNFLVLMEGSRYITL